MTDEKKSSEISQAPKTKEQKNSHRLRKEYEETIVLAAQGHGVATIAKATGTSPKTVRTRIRAMKDVFVELPNVAKYRRAKADVLSAVELAALKRAGEKMGTASVRDAIYAFDKISHAGRLERGQSTENISIQFTGKIDLNDIKEK